jgi:CheY-like chemotaxis protein
MGGELQVESGLGKGSRFWFEVPLIPEQNAADVTSRIDDRDSALDMRLVAGQQVTALVVDDHTISRRITAVLLESLGVQTITAADGAEGIELAQRHHPDIVLMDLRMKGIDGIEATRRLQTGAATASVPVLAITASPFENARNAALEAGCREFLAKPVHAADLIGALERHLGVRFEPLVSERDDPDDLEDDGRSALSEVAERLREAAAIGSISDLHGIAHRLIQGSPQQARLGRRIARLVDQFEFQSIEQLASGGDISNDAAGEPAG